VLFGRLWYGEPNAVANAIDYAKFYSRSHDAVIRVYDEAGNVIETSEQADAINTITGFVDWTVHRTNFVISLGFKFSCWLALRAALG
jgi:hypothetical protein